MDLGSGPGRFLGFVGGRRSRTVALDLSFEMLRFRPVPANPTFRAIARVRANALRPPLAPGSCSEVVVFGNALGFAEVDAERMLSASEELVAPGGTLNVEIAPAAGEKSRYLARLPPGSVARLLRAPVRGILPRVESEGFAREPRRKQGTSAFRRLEATDLTDRWNAKGWSVREILSVAPALGADPERVAAVRPDAKAWGHLLELEEHQGRREARWPGAAAILLSAQRPSREGMIK